MTNTPLAMNFNVIQDSSEVQELQKAQNYINALQTQITTLQNQVKNFTTEITALQSIVSVARYAYLIPTTGQSTTIAAGKDTLILAPVTLLASFTVIMPASPLDGQNALISAGGFGITALTLSPNTGQAFSAGSAITTLAANAWARYVEFKR